MSKYMYLLDMLNTALHLWSWQEGAGSDMASDGVSADAKPGTAPAGHDRGLGMIAPPEDLFPIDNIGDLALSALERTASFFGEFGEFAGRLPGFVPVPPSPPFFVRIEDVPNVYQGHLKSRYYNKCRHAVLYDVKKFLEGVKNIPAAVVRKVFPSREIYNEDVVSWLPHDKWHGREAKKSILRPEPEGLKGITELINRHIEEGHPAIVYVLHKAKRASKSGVHVICVDGLIKKGGRVVGYTFLDPGSKSEEQKKGKLMWDDEVGNFVKEGSDPRSSKTVKHSYHLLGAYN